MLFLGGAAVCGVLLSDPGPVPGHLLDPEQYFVLHDLQEDKISGDMALTDLLR